MAYTSDIKKLPRHFLLKDISITNCEALEPWFKKLLERPIHSKADFPRIAAAVAQPRQPPADRRPLILPARAGGSRP
mgnify:CR=1 FL=1